LTHMLPAKTGIHALVEAREINASNADQGFIPDIVCPDHRKFENLIGLAEREANRIDLLWESRHPWQIGHTS